METSKIWIWTEETRRKELRCCCFLVFIHGSLLNQVRSKFSTLYRIGRFAWIKNINFDSCMSVITAAPGQMPFEETEPHHNIEHCRPSTQADDTNKQAKLNFIFMQDHIRDTILHGEFSPRIGTNQITLL